MAASKSCELVSWSFLGLGMRCAVVRRKGFVKNALELAPKERADLLEGRLSISMTRLATSRESVCVFVGAL